jgi:3-hydroxyisobutyrate dehydrogenase
MLPNTNIVNSTWNEIISYKPAKGTHIIDSSTINPIESKIFSSNAEKEGYYPADAPVSGGVTGALNGTLTFMVGCQKDKFELKREFLLSMGKNIIHCGDYGTGQTVKVCNNLVLGITNAGLSEALVLGQKLGIDMQVLCKVMSVSSASCWALNSNCPVPNFLPNVSSSRNYEGGFSTELMSKDMNLALEIANKLNKPSKLGEVASGYYKEIIEKGQNKKDFSIVYNHLLDKKI